MQFFKIKNNKFSCAFLLLFVGLRPQPATAIGETVLAITDTTLGVATLIARNWNTLKPMFEDVTGLVMREKQNEVLDGLGEVNRQIDRIEERYSQNVALAVQSFNAVLAKNYILMAKMYDISKTMDDISLRFKQMKDYETNKDKLEMSTLIDFAEWIVSPSADSVRHLTERLHLIFLGADEKENTTNLLTLLVNSYEESNEQMCLKQQSAQQFVYLLYADIALAELKGYTMMEFSWMMLRVYGKGNFSKEEELMRKDFEHRNKRTLRLLREVMERADRTVWRCDPGKHVLGQTYDEVTRLLQGYIENEVDLNSDERCRNTCPDYQSTKSFGCYKEEFCSKQPRCTGKVYNCQFVDRDMWVCPAHWNSTRRYDYIRYNNGRILGRSTGCKRNTNEAESWRRWIFWNCHYCFCLCDEVSQKSDRYFNLRESLADVQNNNVVTGLRFIKKNRVFHLQIQEGQLLSRGAVNSSSLTWRAVDDYQIHDPNVQNGRDYHMLTYESRSMDLDDIYTDEKAYVVTGVRFRVVGTHLKLEAKLSKYDFVTGKLVQPKDNYVWKSNYNMHNEITLVNPDISIRTIAKSSLDSSHNDYIDFINTSMDKDAAQSTVPFIDIQKVVSNPPMPLSGIGIYHKGVPGYGGFLAPKIMTYDFTQHAGPRAE